MRVSYGDIGPINLMKDFDLPWWFVAMALGMVAVPAAGAYYAFRKKGPVVAGAAAAGTGVIAWTLLRERR